MKLKYVSHGKQFLKTQQINPNFYPEKTNKIRKMLIEKDGSISLLL